MGIFNKKEEVKSLFEGVGVKKCALGSGNFATVYKCKKKSGLKPTEVDNWEQTPDEVAIKVIDKSKVEDMNDVEREINIMKDLDHENIVKLYHVFKEPKKINLVMALVEGGELFDAIVEDGNFTEKKAARVMTQLCKALDYMHDRKIVHRDLKPENLLLKSKDKDNINIMVADFGLARVVSPTDMMKTACGTPGYVAPEILQNKGYDSGAVDVWSAGVILYIMLCGFPPFYEEELPALFDSILKAKYDFPSPWWDNISSAENAGAKDLVKKILVVDPKKRLDAKSVIQHGWITTHAGDQLLNVKEQLTKYNASVKMKKAAQRLATASKFAKKLKKSQVAPAPPPAAA